MNRITPILISVMAFFALVNTHCTAEETGQRNYAFDANGISRAVLENYLSRAITQGEFLLPPSDAVFEENLRMLKNIGAKFIGRAAFEWTPLMGNEEHFRKVEKYAAKAHEADPEFLFQCCIFEAVFKTGNSLSPEYGVDIIPVPDWVFKEFNLPVEKRNFNFEAMRYQDGTYHGHWGNGAGSVPDITRVETQMYFFYRAARYINAGIEGIHFGQLEIMNFNDPDNAVAYALVERIRNYAAKHARRGYVLFDAHVPTHGFVSEDGRLLLDFHSFPQRPKEICGKPYEAELVIGFQDALYTKSKGGITPSGWECESLPYLVEMDNSGAENPGVCGGDEWWWPWGWDEITWFAHCSDEYRNYWLNYVVDWLEENDPAGNLQMPGSTTIQADPIEKDGHTIWKYRLNNPSPACPDGFGQEATVKAIWNRK